MNIMKMKLWRMSLTILLKKQINETSCAVTCVECHKRTWKKKWWITTLQWLEENIYSQHGNSTNIVWCNMQLKSDHEVVVYARKIYSWDGNSKDLTRCCSVCEKHVMTWRKVLYHTLKSGFCKKDNNQTWTECSKKLAEHYTCK